jgi:hypothetical protein
VYRGDNETDVIGWYGGIKPTDGKSWLNSIPLLEDNDTIGDAIEYSKDGGATWNNKADDSYNTNLECFERRRYTTFINAMNKEPKEEEVYAAKMIGWDKPKDNDGWTTVKFEANKYVTGTTTFCFQGTTTDVLFPPLWFLVTAQ